MSPERWDAGVARLAAALADVAADPVTMVRVAEAMDPPPGCRARRIRRRPPEVEPP